jgi:type I restriction enzyme S subunit
MIEGLQPYTKYKESDQKWLGRIPAHWSLLPNRALFDEVKDRDHPSDEMLSVTITRGIIHQRALLSDTAKKDSSNINKAAYKLVQPGDIAYNKMRAWQGAVGASSLRGIVSPAYVVMRPRRACTPWYYHHLYRTPSFAKEAERWSYGITSDMWSLRPEHFKVIYSVQPPPDEQTAIVRFLNHANQKTDGFIRAKRKLIMLLGEQKQTIIHRAVMRGINPNALLKPSDIAWLGDIPKHWGIVRNMALFAHRVEPGTPGLPVLQVSLRSGITAEKLDQFGRPKRLIADATKYKRIHKGDVAYNTMRMWQGAVGVSPDDGLVSPAYVVLKPRKETCPEFYDFIFHTEIYKQQVNRQSTGIVSDRNRLYWDSFKQMPNLTLPRNEQEEIVAFIAKKTAALNTAIARTEREIALMQEYRTRLTADVVTGKLDVRAAATKLPALPADVTPDPALDEPLEESEPDEIEP